jgi:hypothetical protein
MTAVKKDYVPAIAEVLGHDDPSTVNGVAFNRRESIPVIEDLAIAS